MTTRASIFIITLALFAATPHAACGPRAGHVEKPEARDNASSSTSSSRDPQAGAQEKSEDPFAAIPRLSVEELAEALKEGRAVALDVRPAEAFEEEHIAGAVSIPEEEVKERAGELPKDKLVVAYCA